MRVFHIRNRGLPNFTFFVIGVVLVAIAILAQLVALTFAIGLGGIRVQVRNVSAVFLFMITAALESILLVEV